MSPFTGTIQLARIVGLRCDLALNLPFYAIQPKRNFLVIWTWRVSSVRRYT